MIETQIQTVDSNLRQALQMFGRARREGEVRELAGITAIYCGMDYGVFNSALLSRPIAGDFERRVELAAEYFRERCAGWSFWVCPDLLDSTLQKRFRKILEAAGMRRISEMPGMVAPRLGPEQRRTDLEIRRVTDPGTRVSFTHIVSVSFDIPYGLCESIYAQEAAWRGDYVGYVGYVNGMAVAITATVVAAGAIGIYSVGTLPAYRRRGYGEALMRHAVDQARLASGLEHVLLQSSPSGLSLYRRLGFRAVSRFEVYLSK